MINSNGSGRTQKKSMGSNTRWKGRFFIALALLYTSIHPVTLFGQDLLISEFVATNTSGLRDEEGEFSDWIEILNPTEQAISLEGWSLTDDVDNLEKWKFPALLIPANSFLLIFASGKDRKDPSVKLHSNFRLDSQGEYLALVSPDGSTSNSEFAPKYPEQLTDTSYGLVMESEIRNFVPAQGSGRILVPTDNALDGSWTLPGFNDEQWLVVDTGIGFLHVEEEREENQPDIPKTLMDLTQPLDIIKPTSGNSPAGETAKKAIDNDPQTKYLNRDKLNAGFTITPAIKGAAIIGIRFTSANDAPDRDPTSFVLTGSNDGISFTEISRGTIPNFNQRFSSVRVAFPNESVFNTYRLIFPTVRNTRSAVAVQIAEIELLALLAIGEKDPTPNPYPDISSLVDISGRNDPINPTSFNSPTNEGVENAIDNDPATKYLNRDKQNSGFTVYPAAGESIVKGLRITSANDAPDRDPTRFLLSGSNDDQNYIEIAIGILPGFSDRFESVEVSFPNSSSFTSYQLIFPEINGSGCCMQIAEVDFLGTIGPSIVVLDEFISTSVEDLMAGKSTSIYLRIPFFVESLPLLDQLELRLRYDDGIVAYLNGVQVALANAPQNANFSSTAITDRPSNEAVIPMRINLNEFSHLIRSGENLLALHGLNEN
ncbi:MAG TPA: hypothetical protein EYG38_18935, partial [Verrucomicrobia bacterium]|nr:hypothetical protein [Verrucomicrobiota bacterium]